MSNESVTSDWNKPYVVLNLLKDLHRKQHVFMWNLLGPGAGNDLYAGYCTSLDYFLANYKPGRNVILFAHSDDQWANNLFTRSVDIDQKLLTTKKDFTEFLSSLTPENETISVLAFICGNELDLTTKSECGRVVWELRGFDAVSSKEAFRELLDLGLCGAFCEGALNVFASYFQSVYPYGRGGFGYEFEFFDGALQLWSKYDEEQAEPYKKVFQDAVYCYSTNFQQFSSSKLCFNNGIDIAQVLKTPEASYLETLNLFYNVFENLRSTIDSEDRSRLMKLTANVLRYRLYMKADQHNRDDTTELEAELQNLGMETAKTSRHLEKDEIRAAILWNKLFQLFKVC